MSDTVWIDAYCELALSLVPLTVFNCKPRLKLRPGPGVRLYEHIREAMLYDNSPWDIYLIHGEGLSEPPGLMPTLLDISTGIPNFTCFEPRRIPTIQPVFVAEVYCSLCYHPKPFLLILPRNLSIKPPML